MRTIKFRARAFEKEWGTNIEKGDWVYGNYFEESIDIEDNITFQTQYFIKSPYGDHYQDIRIDIKTLGQFTGLLDKNGKEVFEGDIIKSEIYEKEDTGTIEWSNDGLYIVNGNHLQDYHFGKIEIIGNIYQNPELLEIKQ